MTHFGVEKHPMFLLAPLRASDLPREHALKSCLPLAWTHREMHGADLNLPPSLNQGHPSELKMQVREINARVSVLVCYTAGADNTVFKILLHLSSPSVFSLIALSLH